MQTRALLMIDFQNDYFPSFEGARWPLVGTEKASEKGAQLLKAFRKNGFPVIHVRHENLTLMAPFFLPNSAGAEIHHSVAALETENVVVKNQVNSFRDTELKELLEKKNVKELVIAGAMSHMCVDTVTRAAVDFGYSCTLVHDACATRDLEFNGVKVPALQVHTAFMAALSFGYAKLASTDEALNGL